MRNSFWIILSVLMAAIGAPVAHADSFTPTFTCTPGTCTTAAPTAPDVSFPSPTTITETWDGLTTTISLGLGTLPTDSYTWDDASKCVPMLLLPCFLLNVTFIVDDVTSGEQFIRVVIASPAPGTLGGEGGLGTLAFSPVAAPEPSSIGLLLLGIGLVFLVRKPTGLGLTRAV